MCFRIYTSVLCVSFLSLSKTSSKRIFKLFCLKHTSLLIHKVHKMNSLALVHVEPSRLNSDCSAMQNVRMGHLMWQLSH